MKTPKLNLSNLQPHPLGALFPPMEDPAYEQLVTGLKTSGYDKREKMVLFEGAILDGNNRYTAIKKARIKPEPDMFEEYKGDDPIGFVTQKNLARRNLTPSQASMIAAKLVEQMEAAEAAAKTAEAANSQSGAKTKAAKKTGKKKAKGAKVTKAAKALGVSPRSVAAARKLAKTNPKAAKDVTAGKTTLHAATQETEKQQSAEQARSEEFAKASERIDSVCGDGFALVAAKKLSSKDILKLAGLDKDEMLRIKPLLEAGWTLKAALGYKSVTLSLAHPIRAAVDRAIAQGGTFTLEVEAYEKKFTVEVKELTA